MANDPTISILLDIYGNLLTKKQKGSLDLYYNQDLSLAEIAEYYNISRQGVRDFIEKGKSYLLEFEKKIGIAKKLASIKKDVSKIMGFVNLISDYNNNYCATKTISNHCYSISKIAEQIFNNY